VKLLLPDHEDDINCSGQEEQSVLLQTLEDLAAEMGKSVDKPLKDSMHALMRLFLWFPDEDEANACGVSIITPAARPGDRRNEIHCFATA
jgi:hypothetical protein